MKAKEKAKELVEKFTMDNTRQGERNGIKCALIAIEEMIDLLNADTWGIEMDRAFEKQDYWLEVKNEIEKL
jgi:hypothetical protein